MNLCSDFRDCLLYKILRKIGILNYPFEIAPKKIYRKLISISQLVESTENLFVVRKSDKSVDEIFDRDFGIINEGVIEPTDVPGMSMNIIGGVFKLPHLPYRISHKEPGGKKWDGIQGIDVLNYAKVAEIEDIATPIFFNVNSLNGIKFPYVISDKILKRQVIESELVYATEGNNMIIEGEIRVEHDPINLNYWHVEMKMYDYNSPAKAVNSATSTFKNKAAKHIVDQLLRVVGKEKLPEDYFVIKPKVYLNEKISTFL